MIEFKIKDGKTWNFLIRHGQSEANIVTGDMPDPPLTGLGRKQAAFMAGCMKDSRIGHIISSPLVRALETAAPFSKELQLPVKVWYLYTKCEISERTEDQRQNN